jgi:hypothetical protein
VRKSGKFVGLKIGYFFTLARRALVGWATAVLS